MTPDAIRNIVGIIGNILTFGLFVSPMPTFYKIWKSKDMEDFSPIPYLATLMNCALWVFYGMPFVHPKSLLIVTINGFGLVVEAFYIIMCFIFSKRKLRMKMLGIFLVEVAFVAIVILVVMLAFHTHELRTKFVGSLCVIFGAIMYGAPLSVMKLVIRTKSVKYMPFFLSFAGFLNGIDWTIYGFIHFDIFVVLPNGIGALLGLAQLILYGYYYRSTPKEEEEKPKAELELPTTTSSV
ncbi:bidirectional sugar transporter SWEET6b-like [Dioscorea cayenensis subsp. rotundata]|uniref:Bidirectional sugar transporter SWEET n=1 Tax=Dioscorea cayennensis subsp. rotundata TaxID=55577 RepID=A0AB40ANN2_DIOCR|nr:bidirectional sugar transporter SWEET6b-like [Dioscorea cayenensis subsp. rotundata]